MKEEEIIKIMETHKLNNSQISRLANLNEKTGFQNVIAYRNGKLKHEKIREKIEKAVIKWQNELFQKRCMLLANTEYAYLYCNYDNKR